MSLELQVVITVVNTEPVTEQPDGSILPSPGQAGIIIRSQKGTTLVDQSGTTIEGAMAVARHKLGQIVEDCRVDADGQLEIVEETARAEGT
jgi:hypothetical protein